MKFYNENILVKKEAHRSNQSRAWKKAICIVLCMAFVLSTCIGCTSYASADEMNALKAELLDAKKSLDTLTKNHEATQQELDSLKNSYEVAENKISSLKEKIDSAEKEIESLKGSNSSAHNEINSLNSSIAAAKQEIESLKENNETIKQELASFKDENAALQQEVDLLQEQVQKLQNSITTNTPVKKIKIYIDQGHNPTSYYNSGATGNGLYEQDLTFQIGFLLAALLKADGRFEVRLSRPTADTVLGTDNTSSLEARVQGAKDFNADYFISLHTNSFEMESVHGTEVYVAGQDSASNSLASSLLQGVVNSTGLKNRGVKLEPNLLVLKKATMPAVLIEMGFISNSSDAALMDEHPELFAQGIYDGILAFLKFSAR